MVILINIKNLNNNKNTKMSSSDNIKIEEVTNNQVKETYKVKLVVLGDSGVGKTNLIKRFINDEFSFESKATIGVEFINKNYRINKEIFKIEIWDTAGQERYKSITAAYYKGAKGALIVYDVTSKSSFNNLDKWIKEIKERGDNNVKLMIAGNKVDLMEEREVQTEEAMDKAKEMEVPVMETSALDSTNVKKAFEYLLKEMYKDILEKINKDKGNTDFDNKEKGDGVNINIDTGKKKKSCC